MIGAVVFLRTFSAAPLPAPAPYAGALPSASPPAGMAVVRLETGVIHRSAAFAYRGGRYGDKREFTMSALLVRHPKGDVLVDTGLGRDFDRHWALMPWAFRAVSDLEKRTPAIDQLARAGYDPKSLRAVLLTHAHWDHVSGLGDFAGTPVWVTPEERRFVTDGGTLTVVARAQEARWEEYGFEGGPYLGFPRHHDVHGDGSIVVVPAPGHTPGSVIVFLTLPSGRRIAMVGDLCWQREGILEREERPWLWRTLADRDAALVRENLLRMAALAARWPELELVPAHDQRAFASLPGW